MTATPGVATVDAVKSKAEPIAGARRHARGGLVLVLDGEPLIGELLHRSLARHGL